MNDLDRVWQASNPRMGLAEPFDNQRGLRVREESQKVLNKISKALKVRANSNSPLRSAVGAESLRHWESIITMHPNSGVDEIFALMNEFLEKKSESSESIIERLNFIEIIDVLTGKGENV